MRTEPDHQAEDAGARSGARPDHIAFVLEGDGESLTRQNCIFHNQLEQILDECSSQGIQTVWIVTQNRLIQADSKNDLNELLTTAIDCLPGHTRQRYDIQLLPECAEKPKEIAVSLSEATASNAASGRLMVLPNYSGKADLVRVLKRLAQDQESPDRLEDLLPRALRFGTEMEPDLIVYFEGRRRLGEACIWSGAYAEFLFSEKHWSQFDLGDFKACLDEYAVRDRRFGAIEDHAGHVPKKEQEAG